MTDLLIEYNDSDPSDPEYVPDNEDIKIIEQETTPKSDHRSSVVWKHVTLISKSDYLAQCNYCAKKLSFRSTISNLKKHLKAVHRNILGNDKLEDANASSKSACPVLSTEDSPEKNGKRKYTRKSTVWDHCHVIPEKAFVARCNYCDQELSYRTSVSNLKKHVLTKHRHAYDVQNNQDDREFDSNSTGAYATPDTSKFKPQTRFRSAIWKYFDLENPATKLAKCKLCHNKLSFNCLSNLKKHLQRKHQRMLFDDDASTDEETEQTAIELNEDSPAWVYFKCLDDVLKIASCLICKKRVEYNDEHDLSRHMSRKHPAIKLAVRNTPRKLMITGDGDIYEIDDGMTKKEPVTSQEEDNSNEWPNCEDEVDALDGIDYINENISEEMQHEMPPKKRHKLVKMSRNERLSSKQRQEDDTPIEMFGKYLVSLLKTLPKHKSDQLQVNIIRQVMEAQINDNSAQLKSNQGSKSVQNTSNDDTHVTSNSETAVAIDEMKGLETTS